MTLHNLFLTGLLLLPLSCNQQSTDNNKSKIADSSENNQSQYEPADVDMDLKKISPHVYYVEGPAGAPTDNNGFMSNAAVVISEKGVTVFDSLGTPSLAYKLKQQIQKITDKPIDSVIVSHFHADHIYGLQVFKDDGAVIYAPLGAKTYLESDAAEGRLKERRESLFPWVNDDTRLVTPDKYIEANQTLKSGSLQLEIVSLGSTHSHGDLMVIVRPDNILLAGDLLFEGRIPFVAGSKPTNWLNNLNGIRPNELNGIIPGHGPASTNPIKALEFTKGYLEYLQSKMMAAVDELIPFEEVYANTEWDKYNKFPAFQVNRRNAYFIYLDLEGNSVQ